MRNVKSNNRVYNVIMIIIGSLSSRFAPSWNKQSVPRKPTRPLKSHYSIDSDMTVLYC
jgi:hypothetical protein